MNPIAFAQSPTPNAAERSYTDGIEQWRQAREASLKNDGGWLSVAGLHWLQAGKNTLGTGGTNDFVLPGGSAPETVGTLTLQGGKVTLQAAPRATVTVNDKPVTSAELKSDAQGKPDKVKIGALTMAIIERGTRVGVRLWDGNAPARTGFTGLKWYPVNEAYRITAKFVPYDLPKKVQIATILGTTEEGTSLGYVTFTLQGQEYRLETQSEGNQLFINFTDATSGDTTYPAGRFLDAPAPKNDQVVLDFNQAYNPPCAFTAFATCPLPPAQNRLRVAIPAGEKKYHASDAEFVPAGQHVEYANDIAAFVQADQAAPPRKGGILFLGSSIFREWSHLSEQMAPLPVMNRAFGGARTWEVLHYADQIVLPYQPKIIVYYCGSNDINSGEKAEGILERYRQFSDKVTESLPDTRIYYVAIFRAPQKQDHWDVVNAANRLIKDYSAKTKNRYFIDANAVVFDKDGKPRMDLYREDHLHYHPTMYVELADFLKPTITQAWQAVNSDSQKQ